MIHINYNDFIDFYNKEGENHRLNGPAVINEKYQTWWVEGKRHRLDGPAIVHNYYMAWYIEDKEYTNYDYNKKLKEMGLSYDIYQSK